jgi:hypothetical protein
MGIQEYSDIFMNTNNYKCLGSYRLNHGFSKTLGISLVTIKRVTWFAAGGRGSKRLASDGLPPDSKPQKISCVGRLVGFAGSCGLAACASYLSAD